VHPAGRVCARARASLSSSPARLRAPIGRHEVKHDGYRILARKDGSRVTLRSRCGAKFTDKLPKVAEAVRSLQAENALIDTGVG
jgi:ATP-dependent DNA ligase